MRRTLCLLSFFLIDLVGQHAAATHAVPAGLEAGFGAENITPLLTGKPVYLAGFRYNRRATKVHDPLYARAIVLKAADRKIALVSVDVIGLFHDFVTRLREQLPDFHFVLVSSTHNHEGPDTMGLWGPSPFTSGVNRDYMQLLEQRIIAAIRAAERAAKPVTARLGTTRAPELVDDHREPYVKHDELTAIQFIGAKGETAGLMVQWNCHPETLGSKNTEISADFIGYTIRYLQEKYGCPIVYFTGTVGGLMTSLGVPLKDEQGRDLADGTLAKTARYGRLVGALAERALKDAKPVMLTPWEIHSRQVFVPLDNKLYQLGRRLGVLQRQAFLWTGNPNQAQSADPRENKKPLCLRTEIGWLRLGEVEAALIPGEIYPELVLDRVQNPADPGADFSDAPIEPALYPQMRGRHRLIIGLANDEIGYIIPKRQWDEKPPFCYGRSKAQYGEKNSIGPETAPILSKAFQELVRGKDKP